MSFGNAIQRRADLLRKRGADATQILLNTSRGATRHAVAAAQDKTPMTADDLSGVGTRSGHLKAHWATDSVTDPVVRPASSGVEYATALANEVDYASYIDQGHRLDKHFVPGLMVNPVTGKLERVDPALGGIMVGIKTSYVSGLFMAEAGRRAFEERAQRELSRLILEVFRP